jgi:ATP-dependent RNA helicase SUPV3L1/SUV3
LRKFDGHHFRPLSAVEVAQIAGRAGRHMNDGSFGTTGEAEMPDAGLIEQIENHRFDPVRVLQWRNPDLDFGSLNHLIRGLESPPPARGLVRARDADDLIALKILSRDEEVARLATSRAGLRRLWQVCQIPDFRKVSMDEHVRLLGRIYRHLSGPAGVLDEDWVAAQVARLDRVEGEVDTLSGRLAHIRTWTYISHRVTWLKRAAHWQERTRDIEDRLSDALHARLTQRFVDRRTAVLMRRLRQRESLIAAVSAEGEVLVEGEFVGKLDGFRFVADPRAEGVHERTLRHAGLAALQSEIAQRADALAGAADADIRLTDAGVLVWRGAQVAKLVENTARANAWLLDPAIALLHDDLLSAAARDRVRARLTAWLDARIAADLGPLRRLRAAEGLAGLARGIAFRLAEAHGVADRAAMEADLRDLSKADRAALRQLGIRFGQRHVFLPALLKPAAARLKLLLWAGARGLGAPPPSVPAGTTSLPFDKYSQSIGQDEAPAADALRLQGFVVLGPRAVRGDMVEKLLDRLRPLHGAAPFVTPPVPALELGCQPAELHGILRALGYRAAAGEDGAPLWRAPKSIHRIKPLRREPHIPDSPFARLRDLIPA